MKNSINILEEYLLGAAAKEVLTKAKVAAEKKWKVYAEFVDNFKLVLILSSMHRALQREFSIMKIADVNMQEDPLVAQRFIYHVLQKIEKNLGQFSVAKDVPNSCKLACQREKLDAERKKVLKKACYDETELFKKTVG